MSDIPVNEISILLDEVSTKVPKLLNAVMSTLYSAEAGKNMGQAVGSLFKELVSAGIPEGFEFSRKKGLPFKCDVPVSFDAFNSNKYFLTCIRIQQHTGHFALHYCYHPGSR